MLNLESYSQIVYTCHTYSLPNRSTSPYCLPLAPTTQWRKAAWQPTRTLFTTRQLYKVIAYIYIYIHTYKYNILIYTCAHIINRYLYIYILYMTYNFFAQQFPGELLRTKLNLQSLSTLLIRRGQPEAYPWHASPYTTLSEGRIWFQQDRRNGSSFPPLKLVYIWQSDIPSN